jgi:alkylation response protein AidB-like acyl-CoA dehydrogenase
MKGLDGGRINIAACSLGAAQGALDAARRYMGKRRQSARHWPSSGTAVRWPTWSPSWWPRGRWCTPLRASSMPVPATPTCGARWPSASATDGFNVCNEALQIHGGYGYIREYPIERLLRDCACTRSWKAPTRSCG